MKNARLMLFFILTLQIATAYSASPSRAETLAGRIHAIGLEAGMAKMGDAFVLRPPTVASHKWTGAGTQVALAGIGVLSVRPDAEDNKAISSLTDVADESYFQQLQKLYALGTSPSKEDLTGWFAGRCYKHGSPSRPEGALLTGVQKVVGDDNGPLFPQKSDFRIASLTSSRVDYFDHLTTDKELEIDSLVSSIFGKLTTAVEIDGALVSKHETSNFEYRVRKYNAFFIGSMALLKDYRDLKSGDVYGACYYFKKVH